MGDIGEPVRRIEFEPFTTEAPTEPAIEPVTTPEKEPAHV